MMWSCCVLLLFGGCRALRAIELREGGEKHHTVELALTLTDIEKTVGSTPIHIAVNGVRRVSKIFSTGSGEPIVLPHLTRGSVVTAHVQTWDACAYWVTPGVKHYTVGEWELAFTTLDENDEGHISDKVYEAYVTIVGWGPLVTIEVDNNHESAKTLDSVKSQETFVYPGLRKGALVKAYSSSGDTCTSRVGNDELECNLDKTWGLKIGSVMETGENKDDEGASYTEGTNYYTMELTLSRDTVSARKLEIGLNGHQIAEKLSPTEAGEPILVNHVKGGSVITAVAHDNEEACTMFIGVGPLTKTCAGWTLNLNIQEEIGDFAKQENFDVSFFVHHGPTKPTTKWGVLFADKYKGYSGNPLLFPRTVSGVSRNTPITATVDTVLVQGCTHTVGEESTTCEKGGWTFTIFSQLNTNHWLDGDHFDWDDMDDDNKPRYSITVKATDSTLSPETTLECVARQDLTFYTEPLGHTIKHVSNNTQLFTPIHLTPIDIADGKTVNSATFVATFKARYPIFFGFYCTIYRVESIMCEADTHDASWTYVPGFTLEIDLH